MYLCLLYCIHVRTYGLYYSMIDIIMWYSSNNNSFHNKVNTKKQHYWVSSGLSEWASEWVGERASKLVEWMK